jgi:excisionase family DNA binding protein
MPRYFVCETCNAKWFAPEELRPCPRCGALAASSERAQSPWSISARPGDVDAQELAKNTEAKMATPNENASWYTVAEIAKLLKVSRSNIYQLIDCGQIVAHRFGGGRGCIRIAKADLDEYLAGARETPSNSLSPRRRGNRRDRLQGVDFQHLDISRALASKNRPAPR